jgi:hypothetical protein
MNRTIQLIAILAACAIMYATGASAAGAAIPDDSWTYPCGGTNNTDFATCERLNYVAQAQRDTADNLHSDLWVMIGVLVAGFTVPPLFRVMFGTTRS